MTETLTAGKPQRARSPKPHDVSITPARTSTGPNSVISTAFTASDASTSQISTRRSSTISTISAGSRGTASTVFGRPKRTSVADKVVPEIPFTPNMVSDFLSVLQPSTTSIA